MPQNAEALPPQEQVAPPGLFRRLAAAFYDAVLLIALWFFATALILPFNQGEAFTSQQIVYPLYLLLVSFLFYTWFWTHGGQTLGIRSWKMIILTREKKPLGWKQASIRFVAMLLSWSLCGLGVLWILIDKQNLSWHDRLSDSEIFFHE